MSLPRTVCLRHVNFFHADHHHTARRFIRVAQPSEMTRSHSPTHLRTSRDLIESRTYCMGQKPSPQSLQKPTSGRFHVRIYCCRGFTNQRAIEQNPGKICSGSTCRQAIDNPAAAARPRDSRMRGLTRAQRPPPPLCGSQGDWRIGLCLVGVPRDRHGRLRLGLRASK